MKILSTLLIYSGFIVYLNYACIAPFFPSLLAKRGLNPLFNSIVFAVLALSYTLCSLISSNIIIPYLGRGKAFTLAIASLIGSAILIGSLNFVLNPSLFMSIAIVARLVQGAATSLALTLGFALLSVAFPHEI